MRSDYPPFNPENKATLGTSKAPIFKYLLKMNRSTDDLFLICIFILQNRRAVCLQAIQSYSTQRLTRKIFSQS